MTTAIVSPPAPSDAPPPPPPPPPAPAPVTLGEVLALGATLAAALVAWASLFLAHIGRHDGWVALAIGVAATVAFGALALHRRHRPIIDVDRRELVAMLAVFVVALVVFLPGFPYAVAEKDPGVYVAHAFHIAEEGSFDIEDPVLADGMPTSLIGPGARWPGIWVNDEGAQRLVPQFFHLYPAAAATAIDIVGSGGVFHLNPFLSALAVVVAFALVRRLFGDVAAVLAAVLLSTNMMELWAARYPTTESMTQLFVLAATLAAALAVSTRWKPAAAAAGVLTGLTLLARPDGILYVLLVVGLGAVLVAFRRWDARATWFAGGLAATLPHALLQAYDFDFAADYAQTNDIPRLWLLGAILVVLFGGAAAWRLVLAPIVAAGYEPWRDRFPPERIERIVGLAIVVLATLMLIVGYLRPYLFGKHYANYNGRRTRSYNEYNTRRLGWFLSRPGLALMLGGVAVASVRRWKANTWLLLAPGLLLLPIYLYRSRISSRLMWWTRRYVPFAIAVVIVLIAIALAWGLLYRGRGRPFVRGAAVVLTAYVVFAFIRMSEPLHGHREFDGSFRVGADLAALAGEEPGVFLWQFPSQEGIFAPAKMFGSPLWLIHGQVSALLPKEPTADAVRAYAAAFPGRPVFVVTAGQKEPEPALGSGLELERVEVLQGNLPIWEESEIYRPSRPIDVGYRINVYRVGLPTT